MKHFNILPLLTFFIGFGSNVSAQSDDQLKLENLKYYLTSFKDNSQSMRYYTDSVKILHLLDQIDVLTAGLEAELDKINITIAEVPQTNLVITEDENGNEVGKEVTPTDETFKGAFHYFAGN